MSQMERVEIRPDFTDDYDMAIVRCPCCGGENLHQERIEIFTRPLGEDSPSLVHVLKDRRAHRVDPPELVPEGRNPSRRRQGLKITMDCETCPAYPELAIVQHKGFTQIFWCKVD